MKTTIKLLALVILVTFSSCDNTKKINYKYAENPKVLACNISNKDLFKEAVYAFENDIHNNYDAQNTRNNYKAYTTFLSFKTRGNMKVTDIASEHSLKIAQALKEDTNLWTTNNGVKALNKSHPVLDCISNNIVDKKIKTTFNALLSTNSLETRLTLPLLSGNATTIHTDGSIRAYIALELFYSQLLDVKLEDLKNPNPQPEPKPAEPAVKGVNFNKTS